MIDHSPNLVSSCAGASITSDRLREAEKRLIQGVFYYERVGHDRRPMTFLPNGRIARGAAGLEVFWSAEERDQDIILTISSEHAATCQLRQCPDAVWRGHWLVHEKMPIELSEIRDGSDVFTEDSAADDKQTLESLFVVSLPRSLSSFLYHVAKGALGLRQPRWTSEGEVLNIDRFVFQMAQPNDGGRKFTLPNRDPGSFKKMLQFLDHVCVRKGFAYKDVVQPFVVAEWLKSRRCPAIRIKRDIAEVAFSMLKNRWYYPTRMEPESGDLQRSILNGLAFAERVLDAIPAVHLNFDEVIFSEEPLQEALFSLYGRGSVKPIKYIDDQFKVDRQRILERKSSRDFEALKELAGVSDFGALGRSGDEIFCRDFAEVRTLMKAT